MDSATLLIVIVATWWFTSRHYKKKFGIRTVQIIDPPAIDEQTESLAKETYLRKKTQGKVRFTDE